MIFRFEVQFHLVFIIYLFAWLSLLLFFRWLLGLLLHFFLPSFILAIIVVVVVCFAVAHRSITVIPAHEHESNEEKNEEGKRKSSSTQINK